MNKIIILIFLICWTTFASIIRVPENFQPPHAIQSAINYANNGDTVSVWGNGNPPFVYYENDTINKNILVVNRSYITTIQGYPPNPSYVVIDSAHEGSIVTFNNGVSQNAILKGFTIQNGTHWPEGGGIYCVQSSPRIDSNIIKHNGYPQASTYRGGGIAILGDDAYPDSTRPIILNNVIHDNIAGEQGGGIFYQYAKPEITGNKIINNIAMYYSGGGISGHDDVSGTQIVGNQIDSNAAPSGRALYFEESHTLVNNNLIRYNTQPDSTIAEAIKSLGSTPDLGNISTTGPGYNWIENNGDTNITTESLMHADGNYWGSVNTSDIRKRICGNVDFDPIAASNRIARVTYYSRCSTDVIVTGDLTVDSGISLTIVPGKSFKFTTTADTNTGDYSGCELLVKGKLRAIGTGANKIKFLPYSTYEQGGNWYGIRLMPNSVGRFVNCSLNYAYCGIQASANDTLVIDSSFIELNQVYGIKMLRSKYAQIRRSKINTSTYGIYSQFTAPFINNNEFTNNTRYGIFFTDTTNATIMSNRITCSPNLLEPTLYGIEVGRVGDEVIIDSNKMSGWKQGGIYIRDSSQAQLSKDSIISNSEYGILCRYSSTPKVRWCVINDNDAGVFCDESGKPDLGTEEDPGYNSIDSSNIYYVVNKNDDQQDSIKAEYNWWGTDRPDPNKFIGAVDYDPLLNEPPEDGGQSAGIVNTLYPFRIYAPKPNPTSNRVKIEYSLPSRCKTVLTIYNTLGKVILKTTEEKEAGRYEYLWNSREFPNGVYIIRLKANDKLGTQKIVISK